MKDYEPVFMPSEKVAKYALNAKYKGSPNLDFTSKHLPSKLSYYFNPYTNFFADVYLARYAIGERVLGLISNLSVRPLEDMILFDSEKGFNHEFKKGMEKNVFVFPKRKDYDNFFKQLGTELGNWVRSNRKRPYRLKMDSKNNIILECEPLKPVL